MWSCYVLLLPSSMLLHVTSSSLFETLSTLRSSPTASSIKRNCDKLRFTKPRAYLGLKHDWQGRQNVARVVRIEMKTWTQHQLPQVVQSSTKHNQLPTKSICNTFIPFLGHTVLWLDAHEVDTCWLCFLLKLHAMCLESRKGFPPDTRMFHRILESKISQSFTVPFTRSIHLSVSLISLQFPFTFNHFIAFFACSFPSLSIIFLDILAISFHFMDFFSSLLAGKRVRSWNFSAQNSRIEKHRVKKGLGWFGLAFYFTAIPPHVHYKGVDNHLWRPWCTPVLLPFRKNPRIPIKNAGGCLS